jgi:membrane associated rhomboid family serine protease
MIFPIGHDQAKLLGLPWVTLALLAACVATFLAVRGAQGFVGGPDVSIDAAFDVWLQHPYLELDPQLLDEAKGGGDGANVADLVAQAQAEAAQAKVDGATRAREQGELDHLTAVALRGSDDAPGPNHPFRRYGWIAAEPHALSLFAHPFFHAGWWHLALALLCVWLAGPALEDVFGRPLFAAVCLLAVVSSAGAHALAEPDAHAPMIGAAGLAAGLLGAFLVRFTRDDIRFAYVFFARGRIVNGTFAAPAWLAVPIWLAAQVFTHFAFGAGQVDTGESLATSATALGAGALAAFALAGLRVEERREAKAVASHGAAQLDPRLQRALAAIARGSHDQGIALATGVLRERPDDPDALLAIWNANVAAGREAAGASSAKRLIELHARHGQLAAAARLWDEVARALPDARVENSVLLRIVPELVVQAHRDTAIGALRAVVASGRALSIGQAVRAAELSAELDPECALRAARTALTSGELADEPRARLEQLARELEAKLGPSAAAVVAPPPAPAPPRAVPLPEDLAVQAPGEAGPTADPDARAEHFELAPTSLAKEGGLDDMATQIYSSTPDDPAPPGSAHGPTGTKVTPATPVELAPAGIRLRIDGGEAMLLAWERVQAVGVGLVSGLAPKPVVVIDLLTNWAEAQTGVLEVLRLRSDSFRARSLVGGDGSALEALRALLAQLLARSGGVPLPDGGAARGLPFREFADPSSYEREVLLLAG